MASTAALDIQRPTAPLQLIWWPQVLLMAFIFILSIIDAIWLQVSGVKLILGDMKVLIPLGFFFAGIGAVYAILRPSPRLALPILVLAQLILFMVPACVFSYAMMTIGRPLVDSTLAAVDMKLGFDWVGYVAFMRQYLWLKTILYWAYGSFVWQIFLLSWVLPLYRRYAALNQLLANLLIGGIVTSAIGAFYPALGGYHHFGVPDHGISTFIPAIEACRSGALSVIDMNSIQGLIMFPSFHTQMSLALILAAWSLPLLRYPVLMLNIVVLLSTPVFGAHYLTDVLAGAALVAVFTMSWRMLERRIAKRSEYIRFADGTA